MAKHRHESSDVDIRGILITGLVIAGVMILSAVLVLVMFRVLDRSSGVPPEVVHGFMPPPDPRLQTNAAAEKREVFEAQEHALNSYGWVDRGRGIMRVPVERAMDAALEKGFPYREE